MSPRLGALHAWIVRAATPEAQVRLGCCLDRIHIPRVLDERYTIPDDFHPHA